MVVQRLLVYSNHFLEYTYSTKMPHSYLIGPSKFYLLLNLYNPKRIWNIFLPSTNIKILTKIKHRTDTFCI